MSTNDSATQQETFTIGIEEEYQIVDPVSRELRPAQEGVLPKARRALGQDVHPELHLSSIEVASPICSTIEEVRAELVRLRRGVIAAAGAEDMRIAAAGTHPFSRWQRQGITPKERYQGIADEYRQLAKEQVIFGCHVHIGLNDRDAAIGVLNRARLWLTPLLALAGNSPFWQAEDTGYNSFRTELWGRWPSAGAPNLFESREEYDALINTLIETGSVEDASKIYWDIRLPAHINTIEFRITDVCLSMDEAALIAALVRAMVRTCYEQAVRDEPFTKARSELLRAAHWRAARYGLSDTLIDTSALETIPAHELISRFLNYLRPALEETGDWETVSALVQETLQRGNGAMRQHEAYRQRERWADVVDYIIAETERGTE